MTEREAPGSVFLACGCSARFSFTLKPLDQQVSRCSTNKEALMNSAVA